MTHPSFMTLSNPWQGKHLLHQWSASSHSTIPLRCWAMMMLIFHGASFSCQIYQAVICLVGWLPTLSAQLIWLYPKPPPPTNPPIPSRCLLEVGLCYRLRELPTGAWALDKHRHILQSSGRSQAWTWDDLSQQSPWWVQLKASSNSLLLLLCLF